MVAPKISVCIPTYEMGGKGAKFLERALSNLLSQDFDDFEVVVSDQSEDHAVRSLCESWDQDLCIAYFDNSAGKRQASANSNFAIDRARGEIVKILFQDDFLWEKMALSRMSDAFDGSEIDWLVCGSCISRDGNSLERTMVPRLTEKMHFGKNAVSSPSVLAMRASCVQKFDENLIWLMDVEMYRRLWRDLGEPAIIKETLVANCIHSGQVSTGITKEIMLEELKHVWRLHGADTSIAGKMEYLKRRLKLAWSK